jgi:RNA polymerase sigma-70 factor, ECF subfamily
MEKEITDEDLMLRYRDGDAGAFEQLYVKHKGGLYRYLLRKCGNASIAEELFQDVWMKLINARGRYEVKAKFSTWLYQLAHNHFIDYYRKHSISASMNQNFQDEEMENIPANSNQQPEQQAGFQQQAETLLQLINELPDEQREAFLLREEAGMGLAEIAEVTGVNLETAKSRLRYAVNRLRKGLMNDE